MRRQVTIELKNDLCITGTLKSVDQFLNIKLDEIRVKDEQKYPHLVCPPSSTTPVRKCVVGANTWEKTNRQR